MDTQTPPTDFADPQFKADPYPLFAQMREQAPVQKARLPNGVEVYAITRFEDVRAGLKDPRLVKNIHNARPGEATEMARVMNNATMLRADPPEHTRLRALAHEAFTPKFVNQLRPHIQEIADALLDAVQARGSMDLIDEFAFPLPITVICEMLGVPANDNRLFRDWSSAIIASGAISSETPQPIPEIGLTLQYLHELVNERRVAPKDDLISAMLHVDQQGDHFSETELLATTLILLIAGHETTVNLIGNGMLALLRHPEQLEKLQAEPALMRGAVDELLRYVNPAQSVNRYAAEDLEIAGTLIPRGSHLVLLVAAANHDADYVANPERLDVTRGNAQHVAFGQGIHYCLGAPLARLEGEIAIATLLRRLPTLRLAIAPEKLVWRPGFELRGLSALPITFAATSE